MSTIFEKSLVRTAKALFENFFFDFNRSHLEINQTLHLHLCSAGEGFLGCIVHTPLVPSFREGTFTFRNKFQKPVSNEKLFKYGKKKKKKKRTSS